jgi:two-component system, NarL family, sensor kinase
MILSLKNMQGNKTLVRNTGSLFLLPALLFCCLTLSLTISAQTPEIDQLHASAKKASGKKQADLYVQVSFAARNVHADTALYFARKATELANELDYTNGKIMANQAMGRVMTVKAQYDLAQKYFAEVIELATAQKNDSMISAGYNGIGSCLWSLGKFAQSLENHFKALAIREKTNDIKGIISSKANIGMVYQSQEKPKLAEQFVNEALELLKTHNDPSLKISTLHTLANIMGMQGKIDEALQIDAEGIVLAERTNNEFSKAMFYDNMANCYLYGTPPDFPKAIEFFQRTLQIDSAFSNKKQMSDSYSNLGNVFLMQEKYTEAIPYFQRSVVLARESGFAQGEQRSYQMMASAYKLSGQPDKAFETLQKSNKVKDSLFNSASEAKMLEMQTLYDTVKKEQKIEQQHNKLRLQNFLFIGIGGLVVLAGLLIHSQIKRHNLKKETQMQAEIMKQQELATKAVLEAEENERQRIAKDLHDGVGQMMSAAKMNLSAFESEISFVNDEQKRSFEKVIGLVDESCKEVRTVSHIMMPNALLKNGLAAAIQDFTDKLDKKSLAVHIYTEGLEERLDSNVETVLYRVLQECVNNVIKHAKATTLDISVLKDKDGINATIEDNGTGFDITDKAKFEGIGLKNIITRVEYLKGTVDFDSAPGRGTVVALHVPV